MIRHPAARALGGAALLFLALPGAASAATLAPVKPCYVSVTAATREAVDVSGAGFTPNSKVDLSMDGAVALAGAQVDPGGNLPAQVLQAPYQPKGERAFNITATEQGNPASTATLTPRVTALNLGIQPRRARPSRRILFRGRGFTAASNVYAHYLFGGKLRKTVSFGRPKDPCGTFTVRRRQIPVRNPRTGPWTLQVDQQKLYSRAPVSVFVRVKIIVQRVFRLR
ncbi:MAG: hypothetical protein M3O90_10750 [Actinomycetota bacterium]|nr:hypothetical protein [Actinomycetota bacterium]